MMSPETVTLGERSFELAVLPWARLKKLLVVFNRIGLALSAGVCDESTLDDATAVLSIGLGLTVEEVDALKVDHREAHDALRALMRVSGLRREMEYLQEVAIRRALEDQRAAIAASTQESGGAVAPA